MLVSKAQNWRMPSRWGIQYWLKISTKKTGECAWMDQALLLLSGLLRFLFLLSLQPIHVRLQQVAVGQLEFVHLLRVDHCGDLLIFEDSPDKAHVLWGFWVRCRSGWNFWVQLLHPFLLCWTWLRNRFCSSIIPLHTDADMSLAPRLVKHEGEFAEEQVIL